MTISFNNINYKKIGKIIAILVIFGSILLNIWLFYRYSFLKNENHKIVEKHIKEISDLIKNNNDKISEKHEENIKNIQENIEKHEENIKKIDESQYQEINLIVKDKVTKIKLADNLSDSHKQTIYVADRFNEIVVHYEVEAKERNKMINELQEKLKNTKENLTKDITDSQIANELDILKKKSIRFGIGLWLHDSLPIQDFLQNQPVPKYGYLSGGVSLNTLILNKVNINLNLGISHQKNNTINPVIGIGVTYFLK